MSSIDIVIPNYNYGRFLEGCVASVLGQNIPDMRILVIDNASTDDSVAIARSLATTNPRIETCLRPKNLGGHASFNEGIDWARADYFAIICADDVLSRGALARAMEALDNHPGAHMAFGRTAFFRDDAEIESGLRSDANGMQLHRGMDFIAKICATGRSPVPGPLAVTRTHIQQHAGHYRPALRHTDDVEMWMRLAVLGDIVELDVVQNFTRIHGANQSAILDNVLAWNTEIEAALESFFGNEGALLADAQTLLRRGRASLSDRAYWCALSNLIRRRPGAGALLAQAFRLRPASAFLPPVSYLVRRPDALHRIRAAIARR
ncbi:glycosyltransferase family A protein [Agrobacterium tumefaciens]|uniref:glycosyltransferase family A protein n=1 Tax=Agrobacterium tumefaciens TaxID=358 RepID=UPI0015726959|nr:glycosyltransferase family 2 protein [Agrobacterium tumefaciens]